MLQPDDVFMRAETCSYVILINYILCNKDVLDYKFIYFINYGIHNEDAWPENSNVIIIRTKQLSLIRIT